MTSTFSQLHDTVSPVWERRKVPTTPMATDLGFYPSFLHQNFPGIRYALAHGSSIFPIEKTGHTLANVPNSVSRMLDLILVVPDGTLPQSETIRFGTEQAWDIFNPVTRTSAQFHGANRCRFPSHYEGRLKNLDLMELAKLQRSPGCPILYFPLIRLPRAGNQSRDVWCKYGVVAESDLINDLINWESFHLAGRMHKSFVSFDPSRDVGAPEDSCFIPPDSLAKAVAINRVRAVQTALLLLPEKFTFGNLLYHIISLSYTGDIRIPFIESKNKITKVLHAQALPLSDIYLNLIFSTPGFIPPARPQSVENPGTEEAQQAKVSDLHEGHAIESQQHTKLKSSNPGTPSERPTQGSGRQGTVHPTPRSFSSSGTQNVLTVSRLPSGLGHVNPELLLLLSKYHQEVATNARERLVETGAGINPDRLEPISTEMRELKEQLLSDQFIITQDKSEKIRQQLFSTLPRGMRQAAEAASSSLRFNRLFSPMSLLSKERLNAPIGHPLPRDEAAIFKGVHSLGRTASVRCATKALRASGFMKCAQYTMQKLSRRLL